MTRSKGSANTVISTKRVSSVKRIRSVKKMQAIALRRRGYSVKEIAERVDIAQSTSSLWVRNVKMNSQAKNRIKQRRKQGMLRAQETRAKKQQSQEAEIQAAAEEVCSKAVPLSSAQTKLFLAVMYGCEGVKDDRQSRLTFINSDPDMIAMFMDYFRGAYELDESKWRCCVHLHDYHNKDVEVDFWARISNIPREQFIKPYVKKSSQQRKREGYRGCLSIRYYDSGIAKELYSIYRNILKGRRLTANHPPPKR